MDDLLKSINIQECLSMSQSFNHVRPIWGSLVVGKNFQHKALLLLRVFSGLIWDLFVSVFQPLEEKASNDPKVVSPAEQAALRTKLRTARGGKPGRPKKTATEGDEDDASDMDEKKPQKTRKVSRKPKPVDDVPKRGKTQSKSKAMKVLKGCKDQQSGEQFFGCSRCRWASKGCLTCKNPKLKARGPRKPKK